MRTNIDKFTGGSWVVTTVNAVYHVDLEKLILTVIDEASENITANVVHLIDFFADLGGTMNIAFRFPEDEGINRFISSRVTAISVLAK